MKKENILTKVSISKLAWFALIANVIVILQGAIVRVTGSGAGCGRHWPSCQGEVIPLNHGIETMIEFSHRTLSAIVLLLALWIAYRVIRTRKMNRGLFVFGLLSLLHITIEALLGAATVLLGLTGETVSTARGIMVATHMVNSLILVGMLTLTVVYARAKTPPWPLKISKQGPLATVLLVSLIGMLVLMFTGGIAAMGDTMFPSDSLGEALRADFDPQSNILLRLRLLHPLIAVSIGIYLFISLGLSRLIKPVKEAEGLARALLAVYFIQLLIGTLNLTLLAPGALQVIHLATAVTAFSLLVTLSVYTLAYSKDPLSELNYLNKPAKEA